MDRPATFAARAGAVAWRVVVTLSVSAAWLALLGSLAAVLVERETVAQRTTDAPGLDKIPFELHSPRTVLLKARDVLERCRQARATGTGTLNGTVVPLSYDAHYNAYVDFTTALAAKTGAADEVDGFARGPVATCLSRELPRAIGQRAELDSRIMWVYVWARDAHEDAFVCWPNTTAPRSYRPRSRPWHGENARKQHEVEVEIKDKQGDKGKVHLFLTARYRDAFSGNRIVSLVMEDATQAATVGVDIRSVTTPALLMSYFVGFTLILVFSIVNLFLARRLGNEALWYWYLAWLVWGIWFAWQICTQVLRLPIFAWSHVAPIAPWVEHLCSIENDVLFAGAALALLEWGNQQRRRLLVGLAGVLLPLVSWCLWPRDSNGLWTGSPWLRAGAAVTVCALLGWGLVRVLGRRAPREWSKRRAWLGIAKGLVIAFFALLATQQIAFAWWDAPWIEDIFLVISPVLKVGLVAGFLLVLLLERYWAGSDVITRMLDAYPEGAVCLDENLTVVRANKRAAEIAGQALEGAHVNDVLFRSLFDTEDLLVRLDGGTASKRPMILKVHDTAALAGFREIRAQVSGVKTGERGAGGVFYVVKFTAEDNV